MKEDNLYNRRRFFRKSMAILLPMISVIGILPIKSYASDLLSTTCKGSCQIQCRSTCNHSCAVGCKVACLQSCINSCRNKCKGVSRSEVPVSPDSVSCVPDTIKTIHQS